MHPENLKVGDWITILNWKPTELINPSTGDIKTVRPRALIGDPLRVMAIDIPFIAVAILGHARVSIDSRAANIMKLSNKYVTSLLSKPMIQGHSHYLGDTHNEVHE